MTGERSDLTSAGDPLVRRAQADAIVQRAADQLRSLLHSLAAEIDPFPPFPGAMFAYGIEVEPGSAESRGCVVLGEDGELYELQLGLDVGQASTGNAVAMRSEERLPLDDLTPGEYVAYAHRAVRAATDYLLRQQEG